MELSFVVVAVASLVQCVLLIMARRDATYWRREYMAASARHDDVIKKISEQRDTVLAGWNKTIDDLAKTTASLKRANDTHEEFRALVKERFGALS